MPPIYRHVVPNVPAWTAGNGKPCYRGDKPSCQKQMEFRATWSGDVATPYGTITGAEMNAAIGATTWSDWPFFYGTSLNTRQSWLWDLGPWFYGTSLSSENYGPKEIDVNFCPGLVWDAARDYWQWVIAVGRLRAENLEIPTAVCDLNNVALFYSSATTEKVRLGNGTILNFTGMLHPDTDPDEVWRNTACDGCSITLSAQYA